MSEGTLKKHIEKKHVILFLFCGVFLFMAALNFITPLIADDYAYSGSQSFWNAVQNEKWQYLNWGGRSIVHFIARIFLMLPKPVFDIMSAACFTWLIAMIYLFANRGKAPKVSLVIFIISAVWLYVSNFGQTILWTTGSCNYLWGTTIILSFVYTYHRAIMSDIRSRHLILLSTGMFILGWIAGWCNENTSGGGIIAVIMLMIWAKFLKQKWQAWMFTGLLGSIVGFLFMTLAPGNSKRAVYFKRESSFIVEKLDKLEICTDFIVRNIVPLIIIFIILTVAVSVFCKQQKIIRSYLYAIAFLATTYALVLSPAIPDRAFFGATIMLIIACACSLSVLLDLSVDTSALSKFISYSVATVIAVQTVLSLPASVLDIARTSKKYRDRDAYIISQKEFGNMNIMVPLITPYPATKYNPMYGLEDLTEDPGHWINQPYATKFGVESIRSVSYGLWAGLYKDGDPKLMGCFDVDEYKSLLLNSEYTLFAVAVLNEENESAVTGYLNEIGFSSGDLLDRTFAGVRVGNETLFEEWNSLKISHSMQLSDYDINLLVDLSSENSTITIDELNVARSAPGIQVIAYDPATNTAKDGVFITFTDHQLVLNR